jgi:hypothetical protein
MLIIRLSGKAYQVFRILECLAKEYPKKNIGEINGRAS